MLRVRGALRATFQFVSVVTAGKRSVLPVTTEIDSKNISSNENADELKGRDAEFFESLFSPALIAFSRTSL